VNWDVEFTDEFGEWYDRLSPLEQERIDAAVMKRQELGPALGRPLADTLEDPELPNLKKLRPGSVRILYMFDPRRTAILLCGGDKRHRWDSFYEEMIPRAKRLHTEYLDELRQEGQI
jgi:hypothetical protein